MLTATVQVMDRDDRRGEDRLAVDGVSTVRGPDARPIDVLVGDLSRDGCHFTTGARFDIGAHVTIGLSGGGAAIARIVRRDRSGYGCAFVAPLTQAQAATAFGRPEVVALPVTPMTSLAPDVDAVTGKWPARERIALIVGAASLLWIGIGALALSLLR